MNWNKNKIPDNQLLQLFINDLQINSECGANAKYVENKRREWLLVLKTPPKTTRYHLPAN